MGASGLPQIQAYQNSGAEQAGISMPQYNWMTSFMPGLGASTGTGSSMGASVPMVQQTPLSYQPDQYGSGATTVQPQTQHWNQMYGPMSVPEMHFARLNRRFGWDPTGIGYGTYWNPGVRPYYQPQTLYPQGSFPSLMR